MALPQWPLASAFTLAMQASHSLCCAALCYVCLSVHMAKAFVACTCCLAQVNYRAKQQPHNLWASRFAIVHVILHVVWAAEISDLYCCLFCMLLGVLSCLQCLQPTLCLPSVLSIVETMSLLPLQTMTRTGAAILNLSCSHFAAVSLGELAQAIPPANFETPASVGIRVGKGLTMDDTHQQLSFGDSPQVIKNAYFAYVQHLL